ncbi:MAG: hypothetical protein IME98_04310 [Proteobacteria bacterium]|nr:hypothetical protein [Pseudomonadota bacterium]
MEEERAYLERLAGLLISLCEESMRFAYLKKNFTELEPVFIAGVLNLLYTGKPDAQGVSELKALFVDPSSLPLVLGKEKFRATYLSAMEMKLERITPFFTDLAPRKSATKQEVREEDGKDSYDTLGTRRSLSKGSVKETLDKLLLDADPMIIENLLNNPRIVRFQVLKIAAARPARPEILVLLARHAKWGKEYGVRVALTMNPYSPPRLAIALLELLNRKDQKQVAVDETLHGQLRRSAMVILNDAHGIDIGKAEGKDVKEKIGAEGQEIGEGSV